MDRPTIIGIADGPMHPESGLLRKVDFVVFGDWPSTFEPQRVGAVLPTNWRYSPLIVAKESFGSRRLVGVQVFWGKDDKELSDFLLSEPKFNTLVVVITGPGDGSASKTAKELGALVEVILSDRLVMVSCMNSKALISYESGVKAKSAPKVKPAPKAKSTVKVPAKETEIVKKVTEAVVVVKTKDEPKHDNK